MKIIVPFSILIASVNLTFTSDIFKDLQADKINNEDISKLVSEIEHSLLECWKEQKIQYHVDPEKSFLSKIFNILNKNFQEDIN